MFQIIRNNKIVKEYPYRIQAVIYCFLAGWVSSGTDDWTNQAHTFLDPNVSIKEVKS